MSSGRAAWSTECRAGSSSAHALLQDGDVVIFDETFAALGPESLSRAIDCAERRAHSLVVIAHP